MFFSRFRSDLCVVCSAGGHLSEALSAIRESNVEAAFITKEDEHVGARLHDREVSFVEDPHTSVFGYLLNFIQSFMILIRLRPKVILSTGAGIALASCILGKLYGSKIIYIESGARVVTPSKTGKFVYKFADVFYVQWKPMLTYYPDATYVGRLI